MARTAVVAGTASAVSGRVARHQAEKFADQDQAIMANRSQGWSQGQQQSAPPPPQAYAAPPPAAPAPAAAPTMADQLQQLAAMRDSGVLTDEEFAAAKAKLLSA